MTLAIRNGTVYDGIHDGITADVLIEGDRIAAVGQFDADADEIDATGLTVAPGFIDIHSHSDFTLLLDPRAISAIHQGVTTEIVGNCGFGCFPISDPSVARLAFYGYSQEIPITWNSAAGYFEAVEAVRPAVNVLSLVPNGQLRLATLGASDRSADENEAKRMQTLLRDSLQEGAWGYSTGLEYSYEQGASEAEVASLARLAPFYATHTRRRAEGTAEAVAEAIRATEGSDTFLEISHLLPRNGMEETSRCIELVEAARDRGQAIAFDMHPRSFGLAFLRSALPPWVQGAAPEEVAALLADPSSREQMQEYRSVVSSLNDWSRVVLLHNDVFPQYGGHNLASIAAQRGQHPFETVCDLFAATLSDPELLMVVLEGIFTQEQQRTAFAHPMCVPESDGTTLAPDTPVGAPFYGAAYIWAGWFWRHIVNEQRLLTPAEAINRLTAAPAERIGLRDRGVLVPGGFADIVVFNANDLRDHGTFLEPGQLVTGVHHLFVNGTPTLRDGRPTGNRSGKVLRSSDSRR
jgi:N-acyl-D-amino-acid deacylase